MHRPASPAQDLDDDERGHLLSSEPNVVLSVGSDKDVPASIRWINFALGAAVLLPWNALITAVPYFLSRLSGSRLQSTFSSYLSATFTLTNFLFVAHATVTAKQRKSSRTIRRTLIIIMLLNLGLTCSTFFVLPPPLFFVFVILNGMLQASAGSYLQNSVVAVASLFGPLAMQSVMSGQSAVGVLVSLIQVFTTLAGIQRNDSLSDSFDEDEAARAAFLFFALSTLLLLSTLALHSWLLTIPAFKSIVIPYEASKNIIRIDEDRETLVGSRNTDAHNLAPVKRSHIVRVGMMNVEYNVAVAYVFLATLAVFPPITSSIRSVQYPPTTLFTHPLLFTAIHFLLYNVGDLIGRYLPMVRCLQFWSSRPLLYMSLGRTLFIPLFLLCNVQSPSSPPMPSPAGTVINSDIVFFIIVLFFGISNGYVSSLIMMAAPSTLHNPRLKNRPEDVDTSATIAQFFLVGGLVIGSFTSFGVKGLLCACNPFTT